MKSEIKKSHHISFRDLNPALQQTAEAQVCDTRQATKTRDLDALGTTREFSIDDFEKSIPERFENTVRKYPNNLALKKGDCFLTYDQLNGVVNRIGRSILEKQGSKIEPIALLFENGIDGIAAIFGTLKTGKFYVALDPSFPTQRNAYMLDDSQTSLIVTNSRNIALAHQLASNGQGVLNIDDIDPNLASDNLGIFVAPDARMSIGYTSGSTGGPKGVVKVHRNQISSLGPMTSIQLDDRFSLIHSVSFGSASGSLFASLLNGASLFPFDIKSEGVSRFAKWLTEEEISICHLPPAAFRELADFLSTQKLVLTLRMIWLSGAPITRRDFELYKNNFSPHTLLNLSMSSTESGRVFSAIVGHAFSFPDEGTPLGYPVPGKEVLLLDDIGREVESGQVGEIAIKGRIHTGYWKRTNFTKEKFISDPSGGDERVYLTGDLGRILADGLVVHLGRKDFMVKIRGYRVEVGEVERALLEHPKVRQSGVIVGNRASGEKYLIGYVVPRAGEVASISELHNFLKTKLPDYMIPSSFVFLEALPLTNGKLDRSQLPLADDNRPNLGLPYAPPLTEVEKSLVQIWEKILDIHPIGLHDDFFELGGHSLLASRLFVEIDKGFGKQLAVTTLFWARNVEQLARIIQHEEWSAPWSLMFPIQTNGSKPPFFWVYGETSDVLLPHYLGSDQPLYGLMHEARTGKRVRYHTVPDIAANHLRDIQAVQPQGPYFLGGFCFGGMVAFEIAQQLRRQGQEVGLLFLVDLGTLANWRFRFEKSVAFRHKIREKLSRHTHDLAKISFREKCEYVQIRVEDRMRGILSKWREGGKKALRTAYLTSGRLLPPLLRQHYVSSVDQWAMRHYEPEMYPGDLILIKSEQKHYDPAIVKNLIAGKFELYEVPSSHSDLLKEPNIVLWANELRACLQKAQLAQQKVHSSRTPSEAEHATKLKEKTETLSI